MLGYCGWVIPKEEVCTMIHQTDTGDIILSASALATLSHEEFEDFQEQARTRLRRLGFAEHISLEEACRIAGGVDPQVLRMIPGLEVTELGTSAIVKTDSVIALVHRAVTALAGSVPKR